MTAAELKSFQSVAEQLAGLSQKGTKEWDMAETELKAFVLSQSSESSQESAGKTEQQNGGTVSQAKAPDSKLSAHILFSGTKPCRHSASVRRKLNSSRQKINR